MPASEQFLAVIVVLGLLCGALWIARRRGVLPQFPGGNHRGQPAFRVTHRIPLTAQHCLHVVETGGTTILVGTHPSGIVFAPQSGAFEQDLRRACGRGTGSAA